ncbi:MAG: FadR/GntR family transcriptional regulator [Phycisphaeraceae bacterium]
MTDDLRRWIFEGKLEPDSELPSQAELADRFNVSRTVVREAMRNLSGQGLIDVGRGRKPRIKPVDPQAAIETLNAMLRRADGSLEHLLEVRRTIEGEVAALAAERASTAQVEQLVQANEDLRNARKLDRRIACDWRFHECLAEATNNPLFVLLIKTLGGLFDELLRRTSHSDTQVVYEAHSRLIDAVRRHHAGDARRIALANLELTRHDLHD